MRLKAAMVSYLRFSDMKGNVHCFFVMSKSPVAPLKAITLLRLELSAAVVASTLDRLIRKGPILKLKARCFGRTVRAYWAIFIMKESVCRQ